MGVSINLNIHSLIVINVPISIFFSWNDPDTWHVWIGTIQTPISANILGIVKGSGYFMIGGQPISPFPPDSALSLPGVAVAVGFSASVIWGSEDIGFTWKSWRRQTWVSRFRRIFSSSESSISRANCNY